MTKTNSVITKNPAVRFDLKAVSMKYVPIGVESYANGDTYIEAVLDLIETLEKEREGKAGDWFNEFFYTCEDEGYFIYTKEDMEYTPED
ncbi:hypothetical protein bcgnr5378_06640 [Bacillus cereus]|uniref:Uncharacterized protein n=1 Tax=Bacillus cereus TaxID=1396 RepID=A0A164L9M4_BACCE|nr:hypothetical protein [Bacillus cereus]KZD55575.1 hypothetical protein B4088_5320 [Bacillus cereus]GCF69248.1 hypothetical protein BC2903_30670 [Bacillus cereus]